MTFSSLQETEQAVVRPSPQTCIPCVLPQASACLLKGPLAFLYSTKYMNLGVRGSLAGGPMMAKG